MKIVIIGRGQVGRRLGSLWQQAGHEVTALRHEGGDASDATNAYPPCSEAFSSLAAEVKSFTGGPVAKSFNLTKK